MSRLVMQARPVRCGVDVGWWMGRIGVVRLFLGVGVELGL